MKHSIETMFLAPSRPLDSRKQIAALMRDYTTDSVNFIFPEDDALTDDDDIATVSRLAEVLCSLADTFDAQTIVDHITTTSPQIVRISHSQKLITRDIGREIKSVKARLAAGYSRARWLFPLFPETILSSLALRLGSGLAITATVMMLILTRANRSSRDVTASTVLHEPTVIWPEPSKLTIEARDTEQNAPQRQSSELSFIPAEVDRPSKKVLHSRRHQVPQGRFVVPDNRTYPIQEAAMIAPQTEDLPAIEAEPETAPVYTYQTTLPPAPKASKRSRWRTLQAIALPFRKLADILAE